MGNKSNKNRNHDIDLRIGYSKVSSDGISKSVKQQKQCFEVGNILKLIAQQEENLTAGSVISSDPIFKSKHNISEKNDGRMSVKSFKAAAFKLRVKLKAMLAKLEKHLDVPTLTV